ncbi:MAG TPA: hypothetical protein VIB11_10000 [Pedococcus sp.]|jgi:hypothetical protein|uniref:hypothetical protein n=1 Tax=Pedococcus sp. TaxID=2860345 RepID=UPI002F94F4E9
MAIQPVSASSRPNIHAWRHALVSAAALWVAVSIGLLVVGRAPYAGLTYVGPLALGAVVVGLVASHLRVRLPAVAYPVLVLGIASAANAPVISLIL